MDNKNTMLLTIIAVATLLVAVVGATFAYFTADNKAQGETVVEVTSQVIGSVAVSNPTPNLHVNLTAADMAEQNEGDSYWATKTASPYATTEEFNSVAQVTLTGDENDNTYNCKFTLNITKPDAIKANDATITFKTNGATITGITSNNPMDLYGMDATYQVSFSQTGNVEEKDIITAAVKLNNLDGTTQDHLAGKTLNFSISNSGMSCTIAE
ncbi:MAG: hypothetical protein IJY87_03010 [Bacilli bacterium]|nr:hypothetical protein [Bacilli bacterium]